MLATILLAAGWLTACSNPPSSSTMSNSPPSAAVVGAETSSDPIDPSADPSISTESTEPGESSPDSPHSTTAPTADPDLDQLVSALRQLPFDSSTLEVARSIVEAAGIQVVSDDETSDPPTAAVAISEWELRNVAAQAANGGGVPAVTLAELAPTEAGQPPVPYLVAAWMRVYDSPGSRFSATLLSNEDLSRPDLMVFPDLVLLLFLADATSATDAAGSTDSTDSPEAHANGLRAPGNLALAGGPGPRPAPAVVAAGPCTAVTSFVHQAIASVANALKVNASRGGFLGFLGKIWNTAVDLAAGAIEGLIRTITQPVVDAMVTVFGTIATVAQVSSFVTQWRATMAPQPESTAFGVDDDVVTGEVALEVHHDEIPIPEIILDCASAVGVDLRHAGSTQGSRLDWDPVNSGRDDLTSPDRSATGTVLDADQRAVFAYQTGQEDSATAKRGEQRFGLLRLRVSVHRNDVAQIQTLVESVLLSQIPDAVRPFVAPVADKLLGSALDHLSALADVTATAYVAVGYHVLPDETTPPAPPTTPSSTTPASSTASGRPRCPTDAEVGAVLGTPILYSQQVPAKTVTAADDDQDTFCSYATGTPGLGASVRIGPDGLRGLEPGQPPADGRPVSVPGPLWAVTLPSSCANDICIVYLGYPDIAAGVSVQGLPHDQAVKTAVALAVVVASG